MPSSRTPSEAGSDRSPATRDGWVELVEQARAGERGAFTELHRDFARLVHGILLAQVGHVGADDLTQEVFLTAWQRLSDLREPKAWPSWLATIARHRARDFLRQQAKRPGTLPPELIDPRGGQVAAHTEAEELLAIIRSLPEAYVEPLVLRLVEGLSGPEIAERCGLTPGYVRVNLHRGMNLLRERLKERAP